MNNKKGFTLIELLAVIAILAIILTITIPIIANTISTSKSNLHDQQVNQLKKAAKMWYLESSVELADGEACKISVDGIISKGYIEGNEVTDPKTGVNMTGYIEISQSGEKAPDYKYVETSTLSDCE